MQGANTFKLHRKIGIYLGLLPVATFFYGLGSMIMGGDPLFWQTTDPLPNALHGWLGLFISIVGVSQITQCLIVKDRRRIRGLHMILGYTLLPLLVIQTILGIEIAMMG